MSEPTPPQVGQFKQLPYVSLIPMGQAASGEIAASYAFLEALKTEWTLKNVPSFEVWCAATCYDPLKDHGGPEFQKLMYILKSQ